MKSLAVLAPVAAAFFAAGWLAKANAPRPSQPSTYWEEKKSFFDTFGSYASIVMIGDSLTDGAEWREVFPGVAVVNRGIDGDTAAGVLKRMDSIVSAKARKAFLMIGINDLKEGRSVDAVLQDYRSIVSRLSESGMKVYVQSTLACNEAKAEWIGCAAMQGKIKQLNRGLAGLASANVTFIDINAELAGANGLKPDLTYDGVHLNGEGYKVWRDRISKFVMTD